MMKKLSTNYYIFQIGRWVSKYNLEDLKISLAKRAFLISAYEVWW